MLLLQVPPWVKVIVLERLARLVFMRSLVELNQKKRKESDLAAMTVSSVAETGGKVIQSSAPDFPSTA